jgi:hypothetical protein
MLSLLLYRVITKAIVTMLLTVGGHGVMMCLHVEKEKVEIHIHSLVAPWVHQSTHIRFTCSINVLEPIQCRLCAFDVSMKAEQKERNKICFAPFLQWFNLHNVLNSDSRQKNHFPRQSFFLASSLLLHHFYFTVDISMAPRRRRQRQ